MSLQAVLGIGHLRNAVGEGHVDGVELVPHLIGGGVQQHLDLVSEFVGRSAFALRVQDVVVRVFRPGIRQTQALMTVKERN